MPINLVLVAEGEEEIGSPHFRQVVTHPEVPAALKKTVGVVRVQDLDHVLSLRARRRAFVARPSRDR